MRDFGASVGIARYRSTADTTGATAATAKIVRQPAASATRPLIVREARMPMSTPDMTVPTTRPRSVSPAGAPAGGGRICPATVVAPTGGIATRRTASEGATAPAVAA